MTLHPIPLNFLIHYMRKIFFSFYQCICECVTVDLVSFVYTTLPLKMGNRKTTFTVSPFVCFSQVATV